MSNVYETRVLDYLRRHGFASGHMEIAKEHGGNNTSGYKRAIAKLLKNGTLIKPDGKLQFSEQHPGAIIEKNLPQDIAKEWMKDDRKIEAQRKAGGIGALASYGANWAQKNPQQTIKVIGQEYGLDWARLMWFARAKQVGIKQVREELKQLRDDLASGKTH